MLTRRAALMGAAGIAAIPVLANAAEAEEIMDTSMAEPADLSNLQRIKRRLVRPPMVHEHEQIAAAVLRAEKQRNTKTAKSSRTPDSADARQTCRGAPARGAGIAPGQGREHRAAPRETRCSRVRT